MGNQPFVSIIIPVFNGSNYLKQAIESALSQTYSRAEVLVINDGSTDDGLTEQIALSYGDRIRYFSKSNGGVASAINLGLQQMGGEWFAWLSHDDMFAPNRLVDDLMVLNNHPEARVIFCRMKIINAAGKIISTVNYPIEHVTNPREALALGGVYMCAMTIHRDCFEVTGPFNETNRTTQDTEMTLRLATTFSFFLNPHIGLYMRAHPDSGTHLLSEQHRQDQRRLCQIIHDELQFRAFFPDISDHSEKVPVAWMWMGSQYLSFGSKAYADEAFDNALKVCQTTGQRIFTKFRIMIIRLVKAILSDRVRARLRVVQRKLKISL